jgi:hypothetical protein
MNNQELQSQAKQTVDLTKRRRFLQKIGVATPVLLTLTSPSVLGAAGNAVCMSQQMSGTASHQTLLCNKGFYTPGSISIPFTVGDLTEGTLFNSQFTGGSNSSFGSLLIASRTSPEAHYIAALLNATHDGSYVLTATQVKSLYNKYQQGGSDSIVLPAFWGVDDIAFLVSTFGQPV